MAESKMWNDWVLFYWLFIILCWFILRTLCTKTDFQFMQIRKKSVQNEMKDYLALKIFFWYSSSCRTASTDISDPLSPLLLIVHLFWQVPGATSCILTELLYVGSSWSSCFCSAIWRGPWENITYELVAASPVMSCMSSSSNFDSFRNGRWLAIQLGLCGVLPPGLVKNCSQHSCVVAVKLFLHPFS